MLEMVEQAGTELCQAQGNLPLARLVWFGLVGLVHFDR